MLRERTFFLVLATLIVAGVAVGRFSGSRREVQPALRVQPRWQTKHARTWQERSFDQPLVIAPAAGVRLARPVSLKVDRSGDVLVLDWSDASVRRFSPSGQPGVSYHLPPGTPGGNPEDFDVDAGGNVWICYHDAGTVASFEPGGKLLATWHFARNPHRIMSAGSAGSAGNDGLVIFAADAGRDLFARYSPRGELAGGFGRLLAGDSQDLLALDGDVARDGAGGFVYAAAHTGLLASYSLNGEPRFLVRTIDPVALPKIVATAGGSRKIAPGSPFAALTVSVSGGLIHVLADLPSRKGGSSRAFDVYDDRDGGYLYSFHAPEQTAFALVAGDRLYTIRDDVVTRWRMLGPGSPG
ncbi:MAG TPA: hypothetical protein VIA62_01075 [Thermoanaerobaculia bacterium]|jgi:hypothetical protein|nr:hypothetical protein [Thermoanaerobaculia bacterium]